MKTMKIFLILVVTGVHALPYAHFDASLRRMETSSSRNLCGICSCTSVNVFCNALQDASLLTHYDGDVEHLFIHYSELANLRKEHFVKFRNIKSLSLNFNKLVINSTELGLLQDVTTLNLEANSLKLFVHGMFDGNANLVNLFVGRNEISHIANGTFLELRRLTTLRVDHNHISRLESQALYGLPALEELDLSYNYLEHVDAEWFDPLPRLQTLRLEHNKVVTLEPALVRLAARSSMTVALEGNLMRCECGSVHEAWLEARTSGLALEVTCAPGQHWDEVLTPLECSMGAKDDFPPRHRRVAHASDGGLSVGGQGWVQVSAVGAVNGSLEYAVSVVVALCILLSVVMAVIVNSWKKPFSASDDCEEEILYEEVR